MAALGRAALRAPDSLPYPGVPPGTPDPTLAAIEHFVVLMMENHSYDNFFGVLPPVRSNGIADGFPMQPSSMTSWNPYGVVATNPYNDGTGRIQHAFLMPSTCQVSAQPSQEWLASHNSYGNGSMDGFVSTPIYFGANLESGPVAMGYWDGSALPFTYSLAETFCIGDRWFCSMLGQTDPNRRYLIAGTSSGMTDDFNLYTSGPGLSSNGQGGDLYPASLEQLALLAAPANGTIFDRLSAFGISWADYNDDFPGSTTAELYPFDDAMTAPYLANNKPVGNPGDTSPGTFFGDCQRGSLPQFTLIDPNYGNQSQENPQDITGGDVFLSQVVNALMSSPIWASTMLVITYDEHGGYYDHVPPPPALAPDAIPPVVAPGESTYDGFRRYGFRVPAVTVSPYSIANGVTHTVHDHTSILAMVERKWNLPAMTYRDANANDLSDFLDLSSPRFEVPPTLAEPGVSTCSNPKYSLPPPGSATT
ncbi:MAG: alkaline phosphatase family protein [Acidimicrobiales bacterium]